MKTLIYNEIMQIINEKKYEGNIAAIKYLIGELNDFKIDPLKTLSSVQLETLVVKIFEKNGAFIPAWRGGTLKDIDIIAKFFDIFPILPIFKCVLNTPYPCV